MNKLTIRIVGITLLLGIALFFVADKLDKPIQTEKIVIIEEVTFSGIIKEPIQIQPMTASMLKAIQVQGVKNLSAKEFGLLKASFKSKNVEAMTMNELTILNQATTRKIKESGNPLQFNSNLNGIEYIEFLINNL